VQAVEAGKGLGGLVMSNFSHVDGGTSYLCLQIKGFRLHCL